MPMGSIPAPATIRASMAAMAAAFGSLAAVAVSVVPARRINKGRNAMLSAITILTTLVYAALGLSVIIAAAIHG